MIRPTLDVIYVDSGGGHRAAALALETVVREQNKPWDLRLYCIQELLDTLDWVRKTTGVPSQDIYNIMLRRGWTAAARELIPIMHLVIRLSHRRQVGVLERRWKDRPADMLVSLIPHFNRALFEAFGKACPGRPFVTILTDIADYPPHFWMERQDQYLICGSDRAVQQARAVGYPDSRISRVSGMILHPRFHTPPPADRAAERVKLGLDPHLITGLVMFGGMGSMDLVRVAKALNHPGSGVQLMLLCGRHEEAFAALRQLDRQVPMFIQGFTPDVSYYMGLADFFIGKPGPGSISEALARQLPVIVERNLQTLPHERYNVDWILEQQVGLEVRSFDQVAEAVGTLLKPGNYERFRANVAALRNRAVWEAVEILERILSDHSAPGQWHPLPSQLST